MPVFGGDESDVDGAGAGVGARGKYVDGSGAVARRQRESDRRDLKDSVDADGRTDKQRHLLRCYKHRGNIY